MNLLLFLGVISATIVYVVGLEGMGLEVVPAVGHRGSSVTMLCHYALQGSPLYYIKWYRGNFEFYRYTPSESPSHKIFPYPGIHVNVGLSNGTQVVLEGVGLGLSGKVTCEVTTDTPIPETTSLSAMLTILDLPESGPVISADRLEVEPGDVLRANCSSPPSKPAPSLTFTINSRQCWEVGVCERKVVALSDTVQWSVTFLTVEVKPSHIQDGRILLKCSAIIPGFYHEETELPVKVAHYHAVMLGPLGTRRQLASRGSRNHKSTIAFVLLYLISSVR